MPELDDDDTEVEETETETEVVETEDQDPGGTEQLGDAGKKALDAMKAKWREERAKRRDIEARFAVLEKQKPADNPTDDKPDTPDPEEIRKQVEAELTAERTRERVLDKIEAKAAKTFVDPDVAPLLLMQQHKIEDFLDDDGKPDLEAIQDALKELLENKPYLAAQGGKRFQGSGDGGARPPKPARPKSLDEAVKMRLST
jgi:hypothetical protein